MVRINLRELKELQKTKTLTELADYYKVHIFDLSNFIYSHGKRNGTYPVDGLRDKRKVKPSYEYPNKLCLVNKIKAGKSVLQISKELNVSYNGLIRHMRKIGLKE